MACVIFLHTLLAKANKMVDAWNQSGKKNGLKSHGLSWCHWGMVVESACLESHDLQVAHLILRERRMDLPQKPAKEGGEMTSFVSTTREMWLLSCGADWRQTGLLHFWEDCIVALSMMPQVWLRKTCGGLTLTPQATVDLQIGHQLFATFLEHLLSYTYFIYG